MSDNVSSWELDLDADDAEAAANALGTALNKVGATDFSELVASLTEMGTVIGIVGAAALAIGESFKLVMDAEAIEQTNQQFDILAKNAGLYGANLKSALETSSGGLVDETSLLKGASEAMAELGQNANKLPQIMTLARQATAVFGGDLMQNFNGISQAIASGNSKMLRHLGIVVDQQKAYEDYAASIGVATNELSAAGKQHAMLNAVLDQGSKEFAGVNTSLAQTTTAWKQFKAAMTDVGDGIALVWNKIAGPQVQSSMKFLADSAHYLSNILKSSLGTGAEAAGASVENLQVKLTNLQKKQQMLAADAAGAKLYDPSLLATTNKQIAETTAELQKQQGVVKQLGAEEQAKFKTEQQNHVQTQKVSEVDVQKREADQKKFYSDLATLRTKNDQAELKSATSIAQVDKANADKKLAIEQQYEIQKKALEKRYDINPQQKAQMEEQLEKQKNLQIADADAALYKEREQALTNYENQNASVAGKVGHAWAAESQKAALEMQDFTKIATGSFNTVQSNADSAFESMGSGAQSAGDAMKGFMLGSLGSIAENAGAVMLAEGVWPPNPIALAGGAALLVLGGFLKSQSKGSTGPSPPTSSGSSSSASASTPAANTTAASSAGPSTTQNPQSSVQFVVQGNLYSSNQAKLEMMDIMRSATDATDFKYTQVGGGT